MIRSNSRLFQKTKSFAVQLKGSPFASTHPGCFWVRRCSTHTAKMAGSLSLEQLEGFRKDFNSCPKNKVAQNSVTKVGIRDACISRTALQSINSTFSFRLPDGKPITNQKSSGRCWIFACLNAMRQPLVKAYNLEKFEFSQTYVYFWDKVERANFALETVISLIEKGEDEEGGRLLSFLLQSPVDDGGQWDMIASLIAKHGVVPRPCMPEAHSSTASRTFGRLLTRKVRQFVHDLRTMYAKDKSVDALKEAKKEMVATIYRMCCVSLGTPPSTITWECMDKNKQYHCVNDVTPLQFYQQIVKPKFDMEAKVCLVHDPRPSSPFYHPYTVQYLGSVVGGQDIRYINVSVNDLKESIRKSLLANEAVWFGCDVGKDFDPTTGYQDLQLFDYKEAFATEFQTLDKSAMLLYGEAIPSHAMLITGFGVTVKDGESVEEANRSNAINKWCVENSWGDDRHDKGFLTMADSWFDQYVFMAVVDKSHISAEAKVARDLPVRQLPPWDPMGTLA